MASDQKQMSDRDPAQIQQLIYNDVDKTISTNGFLVGKVGNKIVRTLASSTVETYDFYDSSTFLYTITITYTDSTLATMAQAERTA